MSKALEMFKITTPLANKVTRFYQSRKAYDRQWARFKDDWTYRQCFDITGFQMNSDNTWTQIDFLPQQEET